MNALEARKRGTAGAAVGTGGLDALEDQYEKFHEFLLGLVDVYREELSLLEFLVFVTIFFQLSAEPQTRFFNRWSDIHHVRHPFEVDTLYSGRKDELRTKLLGETLRFRVSQNAKDLLSDFLSQRPNLQTLISKNFSIDSHGTSHHFAPSAGLAALIGESERLATAENSLDTVRKQEVVRWGVNKRMRTFLMGPNISLPANPPAKIGSIETEPPTTTLFYKEYVDKLIPPAAQGGLDSQQQPPPQPTSASSSKRIRPVSKDSNPVSAGAAGASEGVEEWPSIALMTFADAASNLCCVASSFSDSGRCVVAGFEDSTARVYVGGGGNEQQSSSQVLVGHSQPVFAAATFQGHVLTCSGDGQARLWSPLGGVYRNTAMFGGGGGSAPPSPLFACAMSPFGHLFACGGRGGTVRVWASDYAKEPVRGLAGAHLGDITALSFHPNAHYLLSGATDRTVRLWDVSTAKVGRTMIGLTAGVESIACDPSGRFVAVGDAGGLVSVFECGSGKRFRTIEPMAWNKARSPVLSLSWSADGSFLAAGCAANVSVFSTSVCYGAEEENSPSSEWLYRTYKTKTDPVLHVDFIRPNVLLAAGLAQ